jgi:hypothetical protein
MFLQWNTHKYTWTSPDGKAHQQIDHIWIDSRWHQSILDAWSFRGADCDTDHYLVVAKVMYTIMANTIYCCFFWDVVQLNLSLKIRTSKPILSGTELLTSLPVNKIMHQSLVLVESIDFFWLELETQSLT